MAQLTKKQKPSTLPVINSHERYSFSPLSIGAVIKSIVTEKRISNRDLAPALNTSMGNINRLYKARTMTLRKLLKVSELLQENLLLRYHPNVPPVENPLKAENEALKKEVAELKEQLKRKEELERENTVLNAKVEVLEKVLSAKR